MSSYTRLVLLNWLKTGRINRYKWSLGTLAPEAKKYKSIMESGVAKEINKEYLKAVACYELEIASNDKSAPVESYVNLAFLYWSFAFQLSDFNIPNNISGEWSVIGGENYMKILESGLDIYPNSAELHFWSKYFYRIIYGADFSEQECRDLIEKYRDPFSSVPYFFLSLFDEDKYQAERQELIVLCNNLPTAKNLYINSLLKG